MKVVPEAFYQIVDIKKVMVDGRCAVIHKQTGQQDLDNQRLLSAHALTIVKKGGLMVHTDEGIPTKVVEGQMALMPKGLYAITDLIPDDDVFEAVVLFFDDGLVKEYLDFKKLGAIEVASERLPVKFRVNSSFTIFIDQLLLLYGEVEAPQSLVRLKLIEALHLIDSKDPEGMFTQKIHELTAKPQKQMIRFMRDHFDKPLDIEDYAALFGKSVSTFRRDFHKHFGTAPKHWLIHQRMQKARLLLEQEDLSINMVAQQSGYQDVPHFIKSFQKHFVLTPKQYALSKRN